MFDRNKKSDIGDTMIGLMTSTSCCTRAADRRSDHRHSLNDRRIWNIRVPRLNFMMCVTFVIASLANIVLAEGDFYLEGVGYREQELQVAKGTRFASEDPRGCAWISFGGGANIFIKGVGLADNPQSNSVIMYSQEFEMEVPAPPLTADDAFGSQPLLGSITYRLPSVDVLFGMPINYFDSYQTMSFEIRVIAEDPDLGPVPLRCAEGREGLCTVVYQKQYTPIVYYLKPPVVYYESYTELWFDPKYTQNLIQDLDNDEMQFINAKLGDSLLDFEFNVDYDTTFTTMNRNRATGQVGELPAGKFYNVSMLWETGKAQIQKTEATHCSYDNQTCYETRSVPVIFNTSSNIGYYTGGMNLTVNGYGFSEGNITATVDGRPCTVISQYQTQFSCLVSPSDGVSVSGVPYAGSHGIVRNFINETTWLNWNRMWDYNSTKYLATSMESPYANGDKLGNLFQGWFVAPASTNYRFYVACDDYCKIRLGDTPDQVENVTTIVDNTYATDYRDWWETRGADRFKRVSDWIRLEKDEHYYIEGWHLEGGGGDHFSTAVEIEQTEIIGHHHSMKEVQYVSVQSAQVFETTRINITNMDNGKYLLVFMNPNDLKSNKSLQISASATADELKAAIKDYYIYNPFILSDINVNRTWFDVNGTETTNVTEAVMSVYYITLRRLIKQSSASTITVVKVSTTATITVDPPAKVQLSAAPLGGKYRIKCVWDGYAPSYSNDIPLTWGAVWANNQMMSGCDQMFEVTQIHGTTDYEYNDNGKAWLIRFVGINKDPGQFEIVSSETDPLTGENITFFHNTTIPYSSNLFYEGIPFEFLKTYETEPQLIVKVNDDPVVCHNLTCDFRYIMPEGEITSFTFTESTRKLEIHGTNLPSVMENITSVQFALSYCTVDPSSLTSTDIVCTLNQDPTCGDWQPLLTSYLGVIPNANDVSNRTVTCSVSSAEPSTGLNLLGGDNITISGQYLPHNLQTSTIEVHFSDSQKTICEAQDSKTSAFVCLTSAFDLGVSAGQSVSATIVINGQTVTNSISLTMKSDVKSSLSLNPPSVSPVLKTKVTVQLEQDFPYTLAKEDLSMNATSVDDSTYIRYLNVIQVNDTAKTFTAMFGGAYSGKFQISIRHKEYGLIGTNGLILDVSASVDEFYPMTGSIYGGTLITIKGKNFGNVYTDNPVQISSNGGIGSVDCFVQETSVNEIKCRLDTNIEPKLGGIENTLIVFLKTSEEAVCEPKAKCVFTWNSFIPEIQGVELIFNNADNVWQLKVTGIDFSGDTTTTELMIGNTRQPTSLQTTTEAIFTINDVQSQSLDQIMLYFDQGLPKNHSLVQAPQTLTPKLISISPKSGSIGGTLITATVPGATVSDKIDILDNAGVSICQSTKVVSYGIVECRTIAQELAATELMVSQNGNNFPCENFDKTECTYEQSADSSFPLVASTSKTDGTIVFTGTNLDIAGFTASATFANVLADSVVIDSATQATATFNLGVPIVNGNTFPQISFAKDKVVHYAVSAIALVSDLAVTDSLSGLQCSFAGQCTYSVTANGLASVMKQNKDANYISVCDEKCEFDESASTSTVTKCKVPRVSTIYSNENFEIAKKSENLKAREFFGDGTDYQLVFDDDLVVAPNIAGATCKVGMKFKEGHVGMLSQVKYFMKDFTKANFKDVTKFQGSRDGINYVDLFTMDINLHEGWNYFHWEQDDQPKFRYYRFYSSKRGGCNINEATLTGVETIDNTDSSYTCNAKLVTGSQVTNLNSIEYSGSLTGALTAVNPRYGTVTGGTEVTFSGIGLSSDISKYTIILDGINCPVSAATTTSVTCTTGKRPGLRTTTLYMYIEGRGLVSNKDIFFRYVSVWSSDTTWGGEFAPMEMESIWIPKGLNLFVDIDRTPLLNAVIVEGSLIFAPEADRNHERFFDAHYIFVNGGTMEVGTEEFPYTSKVTITMHSSVDDPYIPIYGNKVIGVRHGTLDMHGPVRTPTWTKLGATVEEGGTVITLIEEVDWQVGELIAIASTDFDGRNGEQRVITHVDATKKVLTLDQPLLHRHFAETQYFGDNGDFIDMRAEVGLLSRNVVFRGDPESSIHTEYGATIFLHSHGDDSLIARLGYIECYNMGQAFKLGRYAIHFHMIGNVHKSYVEGIGLHQSNNRAITIHGTHYLRILKNVAFEVKGHTVFIEDAIEQNNYIYKNLIMKTMRSMSLLNTDQTPGNFWLTHPNNIFIDNAAAGSDRYGFWFDLQEHAMGPSADTSVCPENDKVGEFRGNSAHSNGRYGLRLFHNMIPRKYPCQPIVYDENNQTDPYWKNPPITAIFQDFVGWKCMRNGAIAKKVGDVRFINFKTADNLLSGMEFAETDFFGHQMARVEGGVVVGRTNNTDWKLDASSPHGVIAPRTEGFLITGVHFYNFNWRDSAALGSCSHCWHPHATDSGARTIATSNLTFHSSVAKKIKYGYPFKAIFRDLDGTLTGKGPESYASFYTMHLAQKECEVLLDEFDGVTCDNSVQIRRVVFHSASPGTFFGMGYRVLNWDDDLIKPMSQEELTAYIDNKEGYGMVYFKEKLKPMNNWAIGYVTGHKYKIHWGQTGLDFDKIKLTLSENWVATDKPIYFVHNYTEYREKIELRVDGVLVDNDTIAADPNDWVPGQYVHYNDPEKQELHFVVNGKNQGNGFNEWAETNYEFTAIKCVTGCSEAIIEVEEVEAEFRYWSDKKNWPNQTLPAEGDTVEIMSGWKMILDVENPPKFHTIKINGVLIFSDEIDIHLQAINIFVRAGELHIGNETHPHQHKAQITLLGEKEADTIVFDNGIEAGNKILINTNLVKMFGTPRTTKMTRLRQEANKNDQEIWVEPGLDLVAGDWIALAPTALKFDAGESQVVSEYDIETGKITLVDHIKYNHYGAPESTAAKYNGVDIRGEVLILTRNVRIVGQDIWSWGCQIVTSDIVEFDMATGDIKNRAGQMLMNNVEVYNCSQIDTERAAIRFENAITNHHQVTNSSFHNGLGWGGRILNSANIEMSNNIFFNFRPFGVAIDSTMNLTFDSNFVGGTTERTTFESLDQKVDKAGLVAVCSADESKCTDVWVTNNIAAGGIYAGFIVPGHECGNYAANKFYGNVAHSIGGVNKMGHGILIYPDSNVPAHAKCIEGSSNAAYKNYYQGAYTYYTTLHVIFTNMTMIDNRNGFGGSLQVDGYSENEYKDLIVEFNDNKIYGESEASDCPADRSFCKPVEKYGFIMNGATHSGKDLHVEDQSPLPIPKIKSLSAWGTKVYLRRNEFINFAKETSEGMRQSVLQINEWQSDYVPMHEFFDTKFIDVEDGAMAYFYDPPEAWANLDDCGNYPCTAPKNALVSFQGTTFEGKKPRWATKEFQLIANNSGISPYIEGCKGYEWMNIYVCTADKLGILLFESQDEDKLDRSMQPIFVTKVGTIQNNNVNAMMDHVWDGFYSGQMRLQRFPILVQADRGSSYDIKMTGTPAKNMLFTLRSQSKTAGSTIRIAYPGAESRSIYVNGVLMQPNPWDDNIQQYGVIKQKFCGENRFIGIQNILEFYLTQECKLEIKPRNAIQTLVRMEWTMEAFFADGGTTSFIDRLTSSLGIHASTVKIVSVYEGSLIVNYEIQADENDPDGSQLAAIQSKQDQMFSSGKMNLGAPVLAYEAKAQIESTSSTYTPVTITAPTYSQTNKNNPNSFNPNAQLVTETQVSYQQNTVKVQLENEAVIKTETIIIDAPVPDAKVVTIMGEKDSNGLMMIAVALGVICVVVFGLCFRHFVMKPKQQLIELEEKIKRAKNVVEPKLEGSDVMAVTKKSYHGVNRDSIIPEDMVQYEPQYDPNNDFKIFGVGDITKGGIQDMKEKMNMADKVEEESSSESDANSPRPQKQVKEFIPSVTVLDSRNSKEGGLSGGSTGGKSSENLKNNNDLPEDRELESFSEDL